jgi:hypothetical protein
VRLRGGGSELCFGDEVYPVFVIGTPKSKDSVVPVFVIEIPVLQCHVGGDASRGAMISCDVIWFCDAGTRHLLHAHLLMVIIILTNILEAMLTRDGFAVKSSRSEHISRASIFSLRRSLLCALML